MFTKYSRNNTKNKLKNASEKYIEKTRKFQHNCSNISKQFHTFRNFKIYTKLISRVHQKNVFKKVENFSTIATINLKNVVFLEILTFIY